jgi:signal transduction histidine kinase
VSLATSDGNVRLDVRDTGEGIDSDRLERIFDPFVRISLAGPGLGIGLTLVRRIAGLHGGAITATSDGPGRGSTFTLVLPLAAERNVDA